MEKQPKKKSNGSMTWRWEQGRKAGLGLRAVFFMRGAWRRGWLRFIASFDTPLPCARTWISTGKQSGTDAFQKSQGRRRTLWGDVLDLYHCGATGISLIYIKKRDKKRNRVNIPLQLPVTRVIFLKLVTDIKSSADTQKGKSVFPTIM